MALKPVGASREFGNWCSVAWAARDQGSYDDRCEQIDISSAVHVAAAPANAANATTHVVAITASTAATTAASTDAAAADVAMLLLMLMLLMVMMLLMMLLLLLLPHCSISDVAVSGCPSLLRYCLRCCRTMTPIKTSVAA